MDSAFIDIVQKLMDEQGKDVLNNRSGFKSLLEGYTQGEYKKESHLLVQAWEAGVATAINSAQELPICKEQQVILLQNDYFLIQEIAADVVDTLAFVLRGDTSKTKAQNPAPNPVLLAQQPTPMPLPSGLDFQIVNGSSIRITKYTGNASILVIPDQIQHLPTTSVGDWAFSGCRKLTHITIPSSVTSIGDWAFSECSALTTIIIPSSVISIGDEVFSGCSTLTNITVDGQNSKYASIDGILFDKPIQTLLVCPPDRWIGVYTIPSSVTSIKEGAFYKCSGLTTITIPPSITSIGDGVFSGCSGLTTITIPSSVTSIEDRVFSGCSALTNITVDEQNTEYASIDGILFDKPIQTILVCPPGRRTGAYTIPSSVTSIGSYAFSGCSGLTNITIPSSVTSIEDGAFSGCSNLIAITIPSSVTSIGSYAFSGCSRLTNITIPSSVTSIEDWTFSGCNRLTTITIPPSVTAIEDWTFYGCSKLKHVTLSRQTTVREHAFDKGFPKRPHILYSD